MATNRITVRNFSSEVGELLEKLRAVRNAVPGFRMPLTNAEFVRAMAAGGASDGFLEAGAAGLGAVPELHTASEVDSEMLRDAIRRSAAYEALADELAAMERGVRYTVALSRLEAADAARKVYAVAKALGRTNGGAANVAREMRRYVRGGKRRRVAPPPVSP